MRNRGLGNPGKAGQVRKIICGICGFLCVLGASVVSLYAATSILTYTENFSTTNYKDAANTTADWNTVLGMLKLILLPQHPLSAYNPNSSFNPTHTLGYRFIPNVNGQITKLGRLAPTYPNNTLCKLWTDAGVLLASGNTPNGAGWQWVTLGTPVNVTAGTAYRVSLWCPSGYDWLTVFAYPTTIGNIQITSYCYLGSSDAFPSNTGTGSLFGVPDIEFVPAGGSYNTSGVAQSLNVNAISPSVITAACLTVSTTLPANTAITCEMTANAGTNWYPVTPGVAFAIPPAGQGSDLRWRANLLTNDSTQTPLLNNLVITYYATTSVTTTNWTSLIAANQKVAMGQSIAHVKFDMQANFGTAHWKRFRVDKFCRAGQALIPDDKIVVQVWMENNGDGFFDAGDQMIVQGNFTNNTCYLNMNRWAVTTAPKTYYIVYKFDKDCGGGQYAGVNISDSSWLEFEDATCVGVPP